MRLMLNALGASEIQEVEKTLNVPYLYLTAYGGHIQPYMLDYNGKQFALGLSEKTDPNGASRIYAYQNNNGVIDGDYVTPGTTPDFSDTNHSFPSLAIHEDYLYFAQVQGHLNSIDIWKSDAPLDASSFTKIAVIPKGTGDFDGFAYPNLFFDNGVMYIYCRSDYFASNLSSTLIKSTNVNFTAFDIVWLFDYDAETANHRWALYPCSPQHYGVNSWRYFIINLRNSKTQSGVDGYERVYLCKTQDYKNFYNLDETIFTDSSLGPYNITANNNFLIETSSSYQKNIGPVLGVVIDDTIVYYIRDENNLGSVKLVSLSVLGKSELQFLTGLNTGTGSFVLNMYVIKGQILIIANFDGGLKKKYLINPDLTGLEVLNEDEKYNRIPYIINSNRYMRAKQGNEQIDVNF